MNIEPNSASDGPTAVLTKTVLLVIGFDGGVFPKSILEDPSVKTSTATGAKSMGRFSSLTHSVYCSSSVDKQLSGRLAKIARSQSIGFVIVSPQSIVNACERFLKTKDGITVEAESPQTKIVKPKPAPAIEGEIKPGKKILVVSSNPDVHTRFKGAASVVVVNGTLLAQPEDVPESGTLMTAIIDRQSHKHLCPRLIGLLEQAGLAPVRVFDCFADIEHHVEKLCEVYRLVFPLRPLVPEKVKVTPKPITPITPPVIPTAPKQREESMPIREQTRPKPSKSQREIIEECLLQGMSKQMMREALETAGFTNKNSNDTAIYLAIKKAKNPGNSAKPVSKQAAGNGEMKQTSTALEISTPTRTERMIRASPVIPARNNGHRAVGPIIDAVQTSGQIDLLESMVENAKEHLAQLELALDNARADQANFAEIREILATAMDKLPR